MRSARCDRGDTLWMGDKQFKRRKKEINPVHIFCSLFSVPYTMADGFKHVSNQYGELSGSGEEEGVGDRQSGIHKKRKSLQLVILKNVRQSSLQRLTPINRVHLVIRVASHRITACSRSLQISCASRFSC
jgi:hypothetical protein